MQQVVYQEQDAIEFAIDDRLTRDEFAEIVHQLESLHTTHGRVNAMFDLTHMDGYDKGIAIDEFRFYRDNEDALRRVAVVCDSNVTGFFTNLFDRFADIELKHFPADERENARSWIFGSSLP